MQLLLDEGVPTRRGVMAIHHEGAYPDVTAALPNTDAAAADVLMLPLFADLTDEQQDHVIARVTAHAMALAA
jgi:dTDP-4-amino-4,6-dideoxygalactose transaminase